MTAQSYNISTLKNSHLLPRYLRLGHTASAILLCLYERGRNQSGLAVAEIEYYTGIPRSSITSTLSSLYRKDLLLKYWSKSDESNSCRVYLANFNAIYKIDSAVKKISEQAHDGTPGVQVVKAPSNSIPSEDDIEWRKVHKPLPRSFDEKKVNQL